MDIGKVASALDSDLRREILKILATNPNTVLDVVNELRRRKFKVKYRETVYRALEKLVDAGLVEKYYDRERGLCYKASMTSLTIDIAKGNVGKIV
jgi:Fe2+ or Zn2+ uptake regulation protein